MPDLIKISDTQERLGLSRSKVEDLLRRNEIAAVKIGTARRVIASTVDEYIARLIDQAGTGS